MKMNFSFTVTARLASMSSEEDKFDVDLEFDLSRAEAFLFRFYRAELLIDDYVILFKYDDSNRVNAIYARDKDHKDAIYLIANSNQLVADVIRGYNYLISMDKIADVLEYDFKTALDMSQVEDEI